MRARVLIQWFAILLIAVPSFAGKPTTSTQTAQGIDVDLHATGSYAAHVNETWRYNEGVAATFFTNALVSGPVATCSGSPTACGDANKPASGDAPAPDSAKLNGAPQGAPGVVDANKCNFLDGGAITGSTYTQSVTKKGLNGQGNWTFTWSYAITPNVASVDPFTAWDLVNTSGSGLAHVSIGADIMGESAMKSAKLSGPKYSFSMLESDGSNRVTNLVLTINGTPYYTDSTVVFPADFTFVTNAGSNGTTSLLQNGDARTILDTDSFAGNNGGGADGSALAKAVMNVVSFDLGEGVYTVTLSGTVKGNSIDTTSTGANISFSITQTLNVITPGCSGH